MFALLLIVGAAVVAAVVGYLVGIETGRMEDP